MGGDKVVPQRCLWDIGRDAWLWRQRYDVTPDEGLRALTTEGEGQPFSIRRFQDDMRLKLGEYARVMSITRQRLRDSRMASR
jgi:hypothetical protein